MWLERLFYDANARIFWGSRRFRGKTCVRTIIKLLTSGHRDFRFSRIMGHENTLSKKWYNAAILDNKPSFRFVFISIINKYFINVLNTYCTKFNILYNSI